MYFRLLTTFILYTFAYPLIGQEKVEKSFFEPADSFDNTRFRNTVIAAGTGYIALNYALYTTWYKNQDLGKFHFFDDSKEWNQVDKMGHIFSGYNQSLLSYKTAKWTGLSESKSLLTGALVAGIFQTNVEIFDGFAEKWGFSWSDFFANGIGIGAMLVQQKLWKEQRISFKVSSSPINYSRDPFLSIDGMASTSMYDRADELFGSSFFERFLKDYNAQTNWASVNIGSFLSESSSFPKYLNIALGYGANNMLGGFENRWSSSGHDFILNSSRYPRSRQFYLSLDLDLTRIKVRNPFIKSVLSVLNMFKLPAPALEYDTAQGFRLHWIFVG